MENTTEYELNDQVRGINIFLHKSDLSEQAREKALNIANDKIITTALRVIIPLQTF